MAREDVPQTVIVPEVARSQSEETTQMLGAVRDAINERRRLYLSYSDAGGTATERQSNPRTQTVGRGGTEDEGASRRIGDGMGLGVLDLTGHVGGATRGVRGYTDEPANLWADDHAQRVLSS